MHQGQHPGLGRAIGSGARRCAQGTDAAYEHDATAAGLLLHQQVGLLGNVERGDQVEANDPFVKPRRSAGRVRCRAAAGVVDQHIETAILGTHGIEQRPQRLQVAHIGGDEVGTSLTHTRQRFGRRAPTNDDPGIGCQKTAGDTRTDALGAAGDQHHLAVVIQPRVTRHGALLILVLTGTLGVKAQALVV
ncbi:hypothetical protein D3C80_1204230 [compost metagenome]